MIKISHKCDTLKKKKKTEQSNEIEADSPIL